VTIYLADVTLSEEREKEQHLMNFDALLFALQLLRADNDSALLYKRLGGPGP